jgi:hypothetical protein
MLAVHQNIIAGIILTFICIIVLRFFPEYVKVAGYSLIVLAFISFIVTYAFAANANFAIIVYMIIFAVILLVIGYQIIDFVWLGNFLHEKLQVIQAFVDAKAPK